MKLARVESLIEKLPQVIEAQVEAIIRRQFLTVDSYFVVRERVARLRKAPEDGSGVQALVFPNQKLKVLEERGKWIRVEFYDYLGQTTQEGWILKKYCTRLVQSVDRKHKKHDFDVALTQTHADMAAGLMVQESPESHLARLDAMNLQEVQRKKAAAAFEAWSKQAGQQASPDAAQLSDEDINGMVRTLR